MTQAFALLLLLVSALTTLTGQEAAGKSSPSSAPAKTAAQSAPATTQAPSGKDTAQAGPAQAPTPPDYSQQAYVIEHYRQSVRFENDGTGVVQTEAQIKISSESGVQALGQLKWGYSALNEKLDIDYVRVRKPDGAVITAQESAVQDLTFPDAPVYTDYHEKHISVPALRPGDVLEYRYVRNIVSPLTPGQFWTSFNFSEHGIILDEQLEINVPKERQIKLKTKPGYDAKITDDGERRIYRWNHSHLEDDEADAKSKTKKPKKKDDEIPSVQLTTYRSWEELGAWYGQLERERRMPDDTVKAQAASLVKGKSDDMAKVKALYEYVSRNIRYVSLSFGLGRYQPHVAAEVFANGYGDCKDKNTLLAALLDAEGFHSTSILINSHIKLDPDVPSPSQFDHVITRVPVNGKDIWLDSTPGIAPFRMLSAGLRGKQALAIPPSGNAELVWTPDELPFEGYDRSHLTGELNETGKLTAHMTMTGRGDSEMMLRYAMRRMPSNRWKDIFDYVLQHSRLQGAEITNLKATDPSATDDPLKVDYDLTVNNFFDWSAAETKFPLPLAVLGLPDEDADDSDSEPIKLGDTQDFKEEQQVKFPAKYKARAPIAVDVKRDYAEYHSVYKYDAGVLSSTRSLKVYMREIPRSRLEDYAAFRRVVLADQAQQVSVENTQPGAAGAGGNESASDLNDSALQAMANQHYELAADLLQRVLKLDPKFKSAWDSLGRAYIGLGKPQQAAEAFQKQIEINPYDDFAYNGLGLAYQQQTKYDDAIKQYQKQIEINPLDQNAHANLGTLYLHQKKFAEAIPELEKAVDILSRNPLLEISLGQAYIGANQTEKGMAAFEKAISVSPTPLVWNNIAYSLSEQNVQLERATQYADAAINGIETRLRDITLENMRAADLGTMELLFSVWDTKGWIEYQRGNSDVAEQFILPAWLAGGTGDEAEHLGEIAEKRGKRDEAIHYYLLSLAAERPAFGARARLMALGVKDIDAKVASARPDLQRERTIPLNKSDKGTAEFYLLISPTKLEQVKFIKGDDNLKSFGDVLQKADVRMKFPPNAQAHVVRRAVVHCGTTSPGTCTLEMVPSSQVRSLE
jgi:tetratricopeptide (TPR) repeat protein